MARGFVYLAAVIDWHSRRVLAWRVSITIEAAFCSAAFIALLKKNEIAISMDGKGCWRDNVFIERLWKSVKYAEVYLRAYDTVSHARESRGRYFTFYNTRRPHTALERQTPDKVYFQRLPLPKAA